MLQSDRNWLYNKAYALDNHTRVRLPRGVKMEALPLKPVSPDAVDRLRVQEKVDGLYVVFSETELAEIAEKMRQIAAEDESRWDK